MLCALGGMVVPDCAMVDPKREYSVLVLGSGSRSGTEASTETVRLWSSRRLWTVDEVPLPDVELLTCLGCRLAA